MITLVLLPGMDGTGDLFEPFIAALGNEFTIKVVRYPSVEPMTYAELESVARAALPSQGRFLLLGESFSGPIAISIAASAPPGLMGLILCCTFARNPHPIFSSLRSLVSVLPVHLAPARVLSTLLLGRFSTAPLRTALDRSLAQVTPATFRARLASVLSVDVTAKLSAVTAPTLYLRASRDRVVPRSASKLIAQLAPGTCIAELDAPHFLLQTAPTKAAQIVREFAQQRSSQQ